MRHLSLLYIILLSLSATYATPGTMTGEVRHATEHTAISNAAVWAEPVGAMPTFPAPAQPAARMVARAEELYGDGQTVPWRARV